MRLVAIAFAAVVAATTAPAQPYPSRPITVVVPAELGGTVPAKDDRTPAKFESYVKSEIERWSPVLKATGANSN